MKALYKALSKAKQEINPIVKGSENPFFKSKYADLNDIIGEVEPILQSNGLMLLQPILNGKVCTSIVHVDTGEQIMSEMELPTVSDPQKLGSAVTYYRRYTLSSLLSLQSIDDDGEILREDLEKVRQQASDLLDTSIYSDDTKINRELAYKIDIANYSELRGYIVELRANQKESVHKSMTEINKLAKAKVDKDD